MACGTLFVPSHHFWSPLPMKRGRACPRPFRSRGRGATARDERRGHVIICSPAGRPVAPSCQQGYSSAIMPLRAAGHGHSREAPRALRGNSGQWPTRVGTREGAGRRSTLRQRKARPRARTTPPVVVAGCLRAGPSPAGVGCERVRCDAIVGAVPGRRGSRAQGHHAAGCRVGTVPLPWPLLACRRRLRAVWTPTDRSIDRRAGRRSARGACHQGSSIGADRAGCDDPAEA
jgi:hypothetical protein